MVILGMLPRMRFIIYSMVSVGIYRRKRNHSQYQAITYLNMCTVFLITDRTNLYALKFLGNLEQNVWHTPSKYIS